MFDVKVVSGRSRPLIAMVESTETGERNQFSLGAFSSLPRAPVRCVFPQSIAGSVFVVIPDVIANQPSQVSLTKNNPVIQQFSATASHPAFGHPVLPRTAIGCSDQAAPQAIEHLGNIPTKLFIPVQDQIFRRGFLGECFSQLLHDPLAGGMFGSVEVEE